jgi:uncharacterized membrane protein HdeD (DUF308 family)
MLNTMARHWWVFGLRGLFAIIFGLLSWIWPRITLQVLTIFFAAYVLVDGVFTVFSAVSTAGTGQKVWLLIQGILEILAGVVTFIWPALTALTLLYIIAIYGLIVGITEIVFAVAARRKITNERFLVISGVLSIIFSIVLLVWPNASLLSIVWLIGIYAIIYGGLLIALAFQLSKWNRIANRTNQSSPA